MNELPIPLGKPMALNKERARQCIKGINQQQLELIRDKNRKRIVLLVAKSG